ncbi:MAG: adenylate/guanylate cyclase domain-containing protein [Cellvibrionaceae bacterium]
MLYHDIEKQRSIKQIEPRYQYYFRVLLSFSASAALVGHSLTSKEINITALVIAIILLVYCVVSYRLILVRSPEYNLNTTWLPIADGFVLSLAISELDYTPWPSLLLIGLLQFNALSQGGVRRWLEANIGVLLGLLMGFFLLGNQSISLESNTTLNSVVMIGAFTYLCLYGVYSYNYQQEILRSNEEFQQDSETFRSHAYKLSRYLPGPVSAMIKGQDYQLETERKRITVFFSDIVGFTELSEELEAETLTELLNSYLSEMSKVANHYNGTVDKFMGDAIMVLFGDDKSTSKGVKKDAIQCASMAIAMTKRMRELQPQWAELGIKKPLQIRIGINSGYCTVGTFGTNKNLDYTALGAHVNLASRLESAGKPGNILVSHETWSLIKDVILCRDKGQIKAKGFSYAIQVYEVIDHRKDLGSNQSYLSESMDGFSMHLDVEKIKNYNKDKVITSLELAAKRLRDKHIP